MFPPNLTINADDFGLHPRVSLAIARCLDEGLIHSFSALPFSDAFHQGLLKDILARHPGARVGAHLSLLDSVPGGRGEHPDHYRDVLSSYCLGKIRPVRVRKEWESHIRSLGSYLGGPERLSHLDGHQHLHLLPGLWGAAGSLQSQFRIPHLRASYESLTGAIFHRFPFGLALQALARFRWHPLQPRLVGFFTSAAFTVEGNRRGLVRVKRFPDAPFELMVHPALSADDPALAGIIWEGADPVRPEQVREMEELRRLREYFRGR